MADFLRNLLTFKYFRSKDCCSNGAHRERVCKFWSKQEWEADKSSSNSSSLHAPQSRYQELEVALDSSSATINQLNENVESLRIGELEQAPSAVSMQQQEEDRNSENKSAPQLEQQVKELQEKKLSEVKEMEMKEDIWTLRRRRCLSPCHASWRTWRAGRPWSNAVFQVESQRFITSLNCDRHLMVVFLHFPTCPLCYSCHHFTSTCYKPHSMLLVLPQ
ncbi:uncharacterized protein [Macaca nemestrina]|uniref:uncharacterized protein isoform X3 n=1 Tax=Macaca nemestrina TaxID=9545 RepID=UPI0039B9430B